MKTRKRAPSLTAAAKKIRLLALDVDGVLTDGRIILDNNGNEYKSFHVRDGHGIKMLMKAGIKVALITGRSSIVVERRAEELGITDVFQKCFDKRKVFRALLEKYELSEDQIAYVGDDIVDAPIMAVVGLPVTVSDCAAEMKKFAKMITRNPGGRGAVREVADLILKAQGLWRGLMDEYFTT